MRFLNNITIGLFKGYQKYEVVQWLKIYLTMEDRRIDYFVFTNSL